MSHLVPSQHPLDTSPNNPLRGELPSDRTILGQRASDALSNASDSAMLYNHSAGTQRRKLGSVDGLKSIPVNCLPTAPSWSKTLGLSMPSLAFAGVRTAPAIPPVSLGPTCERWAWGVVRVGLFMVIISYGNPGFRLRGERCMIWPASKGVGAVIGHWSGRGR
jgi:hypothetical protein